MKIAKTNNPLSGSIIVRHEPVHSLLNSLLHRSELEIRQVLSQLGIRSRLLELSVRLGMVVLDIVVIDRIRNVVHHITDRHLLILSNGQNDGRDLLVLTEHPHNQLSHIDVVDELAQRLARTPDTHRLAGLLGLVELVDQTGNDVATFNLVVIIRTVDVGGHDGGEVASVFLSIQTIHHLDHTLGVGVSFVGIVWRTRMNHGFIDGVGRLVREDARRKTRNELLHLELTAQLHHVHVHDNVIIVKLHLVGHVIEQTSDLSSQVNHISRLVFFKNSTGCFTVSKYHETVIALQKVAVLGAQENPIFILLLSILLHSFKGQLNTSSD